MHFWGRDRGRSGRAEKSGSVNTGYVTANRLMTECEGNTLSQA